MLRIGIRTFGHFHFKSIPTLIQSSHNRRVGNGVGDPEVGSGTERKRIPRVFKSRRTGLVTRSVEVRLLLELSRQSVMNCKVHELNIFPNLGN